MTTALPPDVAAGHLPARFAEIVLSVSRRLTLLTAHQAGPISLSPLEAMVMRQIDAEPGTTPSRVAARLGLKSSNTSAALRDLEAKGFITRTVDPTDGRGVRIDPTPLARENLERKRGQWSELLLPLLAQPESLASVVELLADLDEALAASSRATREATAGAPEAIQ